MAKPADPRPLETQLVESDFSQCASEKFDYVVIGSSFCAYGFVKKLLSNKPDAKIWIIEKGNYCPDIQSLSPVELGEQKKETEIVQWKFVSEDTPIKKVQGVYHFVGGQSSFWKAWCPTPTREEMMGWPYEVVDKILKFYPHAKELLSVESVNKIGEKQFCQLQNTLFMQLKKTEKENSLITRVEHASLALVQKDSEYGNYSKFSVVEPLTEIVKSFDNVKMVTNCEVSKIIMSKDSKATDLFTSKGNISLGAAKLILAVSTLPCTILTQNSSIGVPGIGERFTGHFASDIFARVPCEGIFSEFACDQAQGDLELAALHVAGFDKSRQPFHIQLSAVAIPGNGTPNLDKMCHLLKTPKKDMFETCRNHIVLVCASLGQVDHDNPSNKFYRNTTGDYILKFETNDKDKNLWETMNSTTFQVLEYLCPSKKIEYWNSVTKCWEKTHPPSNLIQRESLVHPASTMWIGDDPSSPVDLDYKVRGVDNVYVTGGALWPTAGSWNPTCAMTALSMDLANKLTAHAMN